MIKSKALLADAWLENESTKAKEMATKQQEQHCQELHRKVNKITARNFFKHLITVAYNIISSLNCFNSLNNLLLLQLNLRLQYGVNKN